MSYATPSPATVIIAICGDRTGKVLPSDFRNFGDSIASSSIAAAVGFAAASGTLVVREGRAKFAGRAHEYMQLSLGSNRGPECAPDIWADAEETLNALSEWAVRFDTAWAAGDVAGVNAALAALWRTSVPSESARAVRAGADLDAQWAALKEMGEACLRSFTYWEALAIVTKELPSTLTVAPCDHDADTPHTVVAAPTFPRPLLARIRAWQARGGRPAESEVLAEAVHTAEAEAGHRWFHVAERKAVFAADALRRMAAGEAFVFPRAA